MGALARARRRRGDGFVPAPEYHVFPNAQSRWASTRRSSTRRGTRCPLVGARAPTPWSPTSSRSRLRSPPSWQGVPVATLIPHVFPPGRPHFPIYSFGARLPARRLGQGAVAQGEGPGRGGLEQGRESSTRPGPGWPARAPATSMAARAASSRSWAPSPSSSTRGPGRSTSTSWDRSCGSRPRHVEPPHRSDAHRPEPLVLIAPSTSQDPEPPAAASRAERALRTRPCA